MNRFRKSRVKLRPSFTRGFHHDSCHRLRGDRRIQDRLQGVIGISAASAAQIAEKCPSPQALCEARSEGGLG